MRVTVSSVGSLHASLVDAIAAPSVPFRAGDRESIVDSAWQAAVAHTIVDGSCSGCSAAGVAAAERCGVGRGALRIVETLGVLDWDPRPAQTTTSKCPHCGGRGWKLAQRVCSYLTDGTATVRSTACLDCAGGGLATPVHPVSDQLTALKAG